MTRQQWIGLCLLAASVMTNHPAFADSIWDRRDQRYGYLFIDVRARRIGDLLTVVVNENTDANNNEQRKLQKDTAASGKFDFAGKASGANGSGGALAAAASVDQSADRSFQGTAQYQSNRQLLDEMQVTVIDILPNGNLVVEGFRRRFVSNEMRLLRVSGVVRPNDIDIANSISSSLIANFNIKYEGGGVESRFTNQGWFGRAVNKVWPF
jgi:flagellar L-ring protein precursor FlgH